MRSGRDLPAPARVHGRRLAVPAALICAAALIVSCDGVAAPADAGAAHVWEADCVEVGPPGDTIYRAVCRDGDVIQAFCEAEGGIEICAGAPTDPDLDVATPRCPRTATVLCTEDGSIDGPRLDDPVCLEDGAPQPSCEI